MWSNKNCYILTKAYVDDFLILKDSKDFDNLECFCACKVSLRLSKLKHYNHVEDLFNKFPNLIDAIEFFSYKVNKNTALTKYTKCIRKRDYINACNYSASALEEIKGLNESYGRRNLNSNSYIDHDTFKIVSSSAFRRLQDKTQLYLMENEDFARRRLTHSLEVSNIAEKIAVNSNLVNIISGKKQKPSIFTNFYDLTDVMSIAKCSGLLHDIGNPPFGHSGEAAISNFFHKDEIKAELSNHDIKEDNILYKDLIKFDGNAQSLRIASKLISFDNKMGASLTAGVLGSIIKYPFDSDGPKDNKLGYFQSEKEIVEILEMLEVFIPYKRNPFAVILECADDLAYLISDLEDGIHKKEITYYDFNNMFEGSEDPICKEFWDKCTNNLKENGNDYLLDFEKSIRPVLFQYRENFISSIKDIRKENDYNHHPIFNHVVYDGVDYNFEIKNESNYSKFFEKLEKIKSVLFTRSKLIVINELQGDVIIDYLLETFFDAIIDADYDFKDENFRIKDGHKKKIISLISENLIKSLFKEIKNIDKTEENLTYYKMRLIVDHVSGMTDTYAKNIYLTLRGEK